MLDKMHRERIKMSNAILVVNVNGYIGDSTKSAIEFAKSLNKEIIYYTDLIKWEDYNLNKLEIRTCDSDNKWALRLHFFVSIYNSSIVDYKRLVLYICIILMKQMLILKSKKYC